MIALEINKIRANALQDGQDCFVFYHGGVADPAHPVHLHHVNLVKCVS